jgi:molecular chaperone DnaK
MSAERVYGIDLGTTYSCIARVDEHGKPVVMNNAEGDSTTPSVVYFESADNVVVGQAAKDVVELFPDLCVSTVKRAMGQPDWRRTFHGQSYRPQDVSSFILRKLATDAEKITGEPVRDVVITCPAYFGINEKEATKQAGELAGLNVRYVIPEPTAAALAYGAEQDEDQVILTYDLGGGTFDVTLIEIKGGEIAVACTGGDHQLGGRDWDDQVVELFARRFEEATGTAAERLLEDQETYQVLLNAAEKAKRALSARQSIVEVVRFGADRAKVELDRDTFDELTRPLLQRTLEMTEQEIAKARAKGFDRIDKLLLVGGSTYMPQVVESVGERFGLPVQQFDPNQAVAKGAALFGHKCQLDERVKIRIAVATGQDREAIDLDRVDAQVLEQAERVVAAEVGMTLPDLRRSRKKVVNVSSKSFGTAAYTSDDRFVVFNLIQVDDRVPVTVTQRFATREDGQSGVAIDCHESVVRAAQAEVDETRQIGEAELEFERPLPARSPVEITYELAEDGRLTVHGRDLTTGRVIRADYRTESVMSREEIDAARTRNLQLQVA